MIIMLLCVYVTVLIFFPCTVDDEGREVCNEGAGMDTRQKRQHVHGLCDAVQADVSTTSLPWLWQGT